MNYVELDDIYAFIIQNLDEFEPSWTNIEPIVTGGYIVVSFRGPNNKYELYPIADDRWLIQKQNQDYTKRTILKKNVADELVDLLYGKTLYGEPIMPIKIYLRFSHLDNFSFIYSREKNEKLYREKRTM